MNRFALLLVALFSCLLQGLAQSYYKPDVLGNDFEQHTFVLPDDYHGAVTATLVRKLSACDTTHRAILYVHGYNDYFFQEEMANRFVDSCFNFYAVDLRKYGRSILPEQYPFEVRDMSEYFVEIDSAIHVIRREGNSEIILMGHSTGGLITSLYCDARKDNLPVQGLILNSPFLEWNFSALFRNVLIPAVAALGSVVPDWALPDASSPSLYGQSLHKDYHGEWDFNTEWKRIVDRGQRFGWIRAIDNGHAQVHEGLDIPCPILLMHADKSIYGDEWSDNFHRGDAVLDVEHIARYGKMLGLKVTELTVENGLHDLVLSQPTVREFVYTEMFAWLRAMKLM